TLEMPSFKGVPGWEFTDLTGLDIDAFESATGGDADAIDRAEKLFHPFEDGIELTQVDGVSALVAEVESASEPFVLPLDVAAQRAVVDRDGQLDWVALGFGSARGKVRMETNLAGEGSHGKVTGAYAGHARQHLDFDTTQEHAAPNTVSDLAFRGVLTDRSNA